MTHEEILETGVSEYKFRGHVLASLEIIKEQLERIVEKA